MASQDLWVVAVTAWPGPDSEHPLIIKLTRSQESSTDSKAVTSVGQACSVLAEWLAELHGDSDDDATPTH